MSFCRNRRQLLAVLVVFAAFLPVSQAADLRSIKVDHKKGTYTLRSEVWFDATLEQVYEIFRYWDYSTQFSSAIVEAKDLPPDDLGRAGFYIRNRGCVLFFCTSFERRGYVEAEKDVEIRAFADPESSDFHFSNEVWTFEAAEGGVVVVYDLKMSPKFWMPPAIGPFLLKRKLKKNGGDAIDRIELLAQAVVSE